LAPMHLVIMPVRTMWEGILGLRLTFGTRLSPKRSP
jgi:hypothetical protein